MKVAKFSNGTFYWFTILLFLGAPNLARSGTFDVKEVYKFYEITGTNSEKLKHQMRKGGLNSAWAHARIKYRITGMCHIIAEITYTLPRWVNYDEGSVDLQRNWNRMFSAIKLHEENHGKNYIAGVKEAAVTDCTKNQEIIQKWDKIDRRYDRRTRHGYTEGVKLP